MHGAFFLACSNKSLTLAAPAPTNNSTNSDPEIMKKVEMFFEYFNNMPFWYQALFIGVVSAIYGLKGADIIKRPK